MRSIETKSDGFKMFVAGPQIDFMEGWREELSREVKKDMGET
jgi:hypothetical protein